MHELSIAQNLLEIVEQYVPPERRAGVREVRVRAGRLSGILPDSLQFCFEAITAGTPLAGSRLKIEEIPIRLKCAACNTTCEVEEPPFRCPLCDGFQVEVVTGMELQVVDIELAEESAETT
jgi:hydrogenase nickel incorporation protein HypA/HybF